MAFTHGQRVRGTDHAAAMILGKFDSCSRRPVSSSLSSPPLPCLYPPFSESAVVASDTAGDRWRILMECLTPDEDVPPFRQDSQKFEVARNFAGLRFFFEEKKSSCFDAPRLAFTNDR